MSFSSHDLVGLGIVDSLRPGIFLNLLTKQDVDKAPLLENHQFLRLPAIMAM